MKPGEIWSKAPGFQEYLFDTPCQYTITVDVLNGKWEIYRGFSRWAIGESPKIVDIETVDGSWKIK